MQIWRNKKKEMLPIILFVSINEIIALTVSLLVALVLSCISGTLARNRLTFLAASRPLVKLGVKAKEFAIEAVPKIKACDTLKSQEC